MIYQLIWKLFNKGLIEYYINHQNKPITHTDLDYAFTDMKGKKYYRVPNELNLSMERNEQLFKYTALMSARLSGENLDMFADEMISVLHKYIQDPKKENLAKVASLANNVKERKDFIVPVQLCYDILCIQYIREDENPITFNNTIHMQKVYQLMEESEDQNGFFFRLPELKKLLNMREISTEEWTQFLIMSKLQDKRIKKSMEVYR